ncbi:MAG TPA: RluA family pseudouridine synthase, partial [Syntrophorhabdaceae bacterium]|nr:RluA family pseudouridine synthase [Syntrophorhabdaceae bacterium]
DIPLEILYEDEYFLAINKQADMVVHPSAGHASGTLVNAVLAYLGQTGAAQSTERIAQDTIVMAGRSGVSPAPDRNLEPRTSNLEPSAWDLESAAPNSALRPGIVHRLDKGTTGVILIAKDAKTQEMLSHMFKDRLVKKTYRAIIEGVPPKTQWRAEGNIGRHPVERKKMAVLKNGGRTAETDFKILQKLDSFTYVEAYPKTGRTHQIRVHLAHGGNPIVGDETYGRKAGKSASRPLLHAYRIEFAHPATGEPVKIEAPIPSDMEEFIDKYRILN